MPKLVPTDPPEQVTTAQERGQMLRHLIARIGKRAPTFAKEAGISRSTLNALLSGTNDVELAEHKTARAILLALGLRDDQVAEALGLSEQARTVWRTDRPTPYGSGPDPASRVAREMRLAQPLMGEVVFPVNTVVTLDQGNTRHGIQVIQLRSGEYFAMKAGPAAESAGKSMGQLLSADFSAVL